MWRGQVTGVSNESDRQRIRGIRNERFEWICHEPGSGPYQVFIALFYCLFSLLDWTTRPPALLGAELLFEFLECQVQQWSSVR